MDFVSPLELASEQINRYVPLFLLAVGLIGNLLNCLIFTHKKIRSNPCAIYFLAASLMNIFGSITGFLPRILNGWNRKLDLTETISLICQSVLFVLLSSRAISTWLIAFASIDRFLISSPEYSRRQMSNLKTTYTCILIISLVLISFWIGTFFCYQANTIGAPVKCFVNSNPCRVYSDYGQALLVIMLPVMLMLFFGFGTIRNIQQRRKVTVTGADDSIPMPRNRRSQRSLTRMLITQVVVLTLFTLPLALMTIYHSSTLDHEKAFSRLAVENFIFNLLLLAAFIPGCISFFLYTLSGSLFREIFLNYGKIIMENVRHFRFH